MNHYYRMDNKIVAVRINGEKFSCEGLDRISGTSKIRAEAKRGVVVKTVSPTGKFDPITGCRELVYL